MTVLVFFQSLDYDRCINDPYLEVLETMDNKVSNLARAERNSQGQDQFSTLGDTKNHNPSVLPLGLLQLDLQLNSNPQVGDMAHHNLET